MNSIVHNFFNQIKTYEEGKQYLQSIKDFTYKDLGSTISKKILFGLIIYKFGKDLGYPEYIVKISRDLVLNILKGTDSHTFISEYIKAFDDWKSQDLKQYIYELSVSYYNLEETRLKTINDPEWIEQIIFLQNKIRKQVHSIRGDILFNTNLNTFNQYKKDTITDMVDNMYWDILEKQIEERDYEMLIKNYIEIKEMLNEIHLDKDTNEILDEEHLTKLLKNNLFNKENLIGHINFIYDKIIIYGIPIYDSIINKTKKDIINDINDNDLTPKIIRKSFEKTMKHLTHLLSNIRLFRNNMKNK